MLRFDFYIPDFKTLIEYDGRHHFEPAFGSTPEKALEVLKRTMQNDSIKNAWAKDNDYLLYRLSNERTLKKDIEKILSDLFAAKS